MKKILIISIALTLALIVSGCGQKDDADQPDNSAKINAPENVKVKPAEIELQDRPGEPAAEEPAEPEITTDDLDKLSSEAKQAEASSDQKANSFNALRDTLDNNVPL